MAISNLTQIKFLQHLRNNNILTDKTEAKNALNDLTLKLNNIENTDGTICLARYNDNSDNSIKTLIGVYNQLSKSITIYDPDVDLEVIENLEKKIDDEIKYRKAIVGQGDVNAYIPTNSKHISSATSLSDADTKLNDAIEAIEKILAKQDIAVTEGNYANGFHINNGNLSIDQTNLINNDDKILSQLNGNIKSTISIVKETSATEENVLEQFKLVGIDGQTALGEPIKIYKDKALKSVTLEGAESTGKQELVFTYITETGAESVVRLDVSKLLVEAEFKNGLHVNEAGEVSIQLDETASDKFLKVDEKGLKTEGLTTAINNAATTVTINTSDINTNNHLEVATSTVDNHKNYEFKLKDVASESELTNEVSRATKAEGEINGRINTLNGEVLKTITPGDGISVSTKSENQQIISVKLDNTRDGNVLENTSNGLYLNNIWDCGTFDYTK